MPRDSRSPARRPAPVKAVALRPRNVLVDVALARGDLRASSSARCSSRASGGRRSPSRRRSISTPRASRVYTLYSLARGVVAYVLSLLFTIAYGKAAAASRRAERFLIPILDVLQSIPVLSFMPGLVLGLIGLFPGLEPRPRARVRARDLHRPGLEHDVQLPRVAARDPARADWRSPGSTGSARSSGSSRSSCHRR